MQQNGIKCDNVTRKDIAVPHQNNTRDCGIFALLCALYHAASLPLIRDSFGPQHIEFVRRMMVWNLVSASIELPVGSAPRSF